MIGNVPELTTFDRCEKPSYTLYIPLQFWFNRFTGLSLPLVALEYFDVRLTIKLRKFQECGYVEDLRLYDDINFAPEVNLDNIFDNSRWSLDMSLMVDYIFLDNVERKKFAQSSHEYLIDQVQYLKVDRIDNTQVQVVLDFVHPCKEIIWVLQKDCFVENRNGFNRCRWDNFTCGAGLSIEGASMDFNGYSRFERFNGGYFNYLQPYDHHTNTPDDGIYVYSFALRPEEHQPTGSCNFSRISKAVLNLWISPCMFTPDNGETVTLWVFAINHNIFRIASGIGATVYI
ncbi:MAG: NCLDV major capsid protein [Hyperionvirus sp.]|uniref:NCLDV major capsid protein n=1 Tax=Hyperionvirus sp. TaxID=2487770 RepID=A0A3G5ABP9_9VIRU|nr:MAG: NCLDV major capsid protein [Hyperionvirus sp.]